MDNNPNYGAPKKWYKTAGGVVFLVFISLVITMILVFAVFMMYYLWQIKFGDPVKLEQSFLNEAKQAQTVEKSIVIADYEKYVRAQNFSSGKATSLITVLAFVDYECPFTKKAYPSLQTVMEKYGTTVNVVFKNFPLQDIHPDAILAANAVLCAKEQNKFLQYQELVLSKDKLDNDSLISYAENLKMDVKKFSDCLTAENNLGVINQDLTDGLELGLRGTPTFFVNGEKYEGPLTIAEWDGIILKFLKK